MYPEDGSYSNNNNQVLLLAAKINKQYLKKKPDPLFVLLYYTPVYFLMSVGKHKLSFASVAIIVYSRLSLERGKHID